MCRLVLTLLIFMAALSSIQEAEARLLFNRPRIIHPIEAPAPRRASVKAVTLLTPAPTPATSVSSGGSCAVGSKSCR